jgi:hypothetical protein
MMHGRNNGKKMMAVSSRCWWCGELQAALPTVRLP